MGDDHDGRAVRLDLLEFLEALRLEIDIAYAQDLINEQYIRIHVNGNGKGETHIHTGRIGSHRIVDKRFQFGEVDDGLQTCIDLLFAQPEDRGIGIDILSAAHIRVKSCPEFNQA